MKLILNGYSMYKSESEMRCDATELFFENKDRKEIVFTHNEVAAIFHARHNKIYKDDDTVYIEVIDEDTGEIMNLNCRKAMHELMKKYMLYPTIIQNIFKP